MVISALVSAWGANAPAAAGGGQGDLQRLMSLLAQRRHGEVRYAEKDYLSVLEGPLKSSGVLIYDAPGHLEKRTLEPKRESLVLDHGVVTIHRGKRTYHFDLSAYPQVAPYVDAIRATMAGDLGALEHVFKVTFAGSLAHWELGLVPLDEKVARGVRRIRIAGAQTDVESVEIDKPNGDRSVMTMGAQAPAQAPGR
jgi:Outer membrane lipoprotein carrier protein LolA-like